MTATAEKVRSSRPVSDEYVPYFETYIGKVPDGDIVRQLRTQLEATVTLVRSIPEERGGHRYAPGKWSVREVIGHVCDCERVFGYRAMCFARADTTALPGFDENLFAANSSFDTRSLDSLASELAAVRAGSVAFFDSLTDEEWLRRGVANGRQMSVRALAWTTAAHERHHVGLLETRDL